MSAQIASFFRNLLHKRTVEQALDDELQSAVELLTQENVKQGLSHSEARRQALIELGGVEQVKEQVRAVRLGGFLETFAQDLRFSLRTMAKAPGFTAIAVLTMAVGIGANTTLANLSCPSEPIDSSRSSDPARCGRSRTASLYGRL